MCHVAAWSLGSFGSGHGHDLGDVATGKWMVLKTGKTETNLVGGAITILKNMSLSMGRMTSHI